MVPMPMSASSLGNSARRQFMYSVSMEQKPKYVARIDNVYFLKHLGASLREATSQVVKEELSEDIRILLRRLERLEARGKARKAD